MLPASQIQSLHCHIGYTKGFICKDNLYFAKDQNFLLKIAMYIWHFIYKKDCLRQHIGHDGVLFRRKPF